MSELHELVVRLDDTLDAIIIADPPLDDYGLYLQRCYGELCKLYSDIARLPGTNALCTILDTHLEPLANLDNGTFVNNLPEAAEALRHELNLYRSAVAA